MPLTFDMPFEKLQTYQGINPRPADFDAYWDRALEEMRAVEPNVELIPAAFKTNFADCYHLYFTGVYGARVYAKFMRPKNIEKPTPAVLFFHGYSGNSGGWVDKLAYVAQGYTVAALDCRGQGGLSRDVGGHMGTTLNGHIIRGLEGPPEAMMYRQLFLDTAQLAKIVMEMPDVDETNVNATGGSQGGGLTLACASLEPRIKRAAARFPFLSDYKRVWEMDQAKNAYAELQTFFRHFDPQHKREDQIFTKLGYIDVQHLAPRIQAEVQMSVGLMDQICPPSTQFAAYNKITSPKSLLVYPDFGHENLPDNNEDIFSFITAD